ncbi:hypothetical protein [Gymnodinialimonas hymeniacidonis]|uniref:hypothetical protein n=1 Tax=Gymnodinialimonas hymeniacidonis TaxID=3126508 RepID=UPI0034C6397A
MNPSKPIIGGNHTFHTSGQFNGMVGGTATVAAGVNLKLNGMVGGDLVIERGATVTLAGMVGGRIDNRGGHLSDG